MTTDTHSDVGELPISNNSAVDQELLDSISETNLNKVHLSIPTQEKSDLVDIDGPTSPVDSSNQSEIPPPTNSTPSSNLSNVLPADGLSSSEATSPKESTDQATSPKERIDQATSPKESIDQATNPKESSDQAPPIHNFLNTQHAHTVAKSFISNDNIPIRTLENSFTNFKRGTTSGRTFERTEANLLKYGFPTTFLEPWFKLFQDLETAFKPVHVYTFMVVLYFQDPKKTPQYSMDYTDAPLKEIRELVNKVTKVFNFYCSKDFTSHASASAQNALFRRLDIDTKTLHSWFEGIRLLSNSAPNSELPTLIKLFLSQVWGRTRNIVIKDNDLTVLTLSQPSNLDQVLPSLDPNLSPSDQLTQSNSPQFDWDGEVSDEEPSYADLEFNIVQDYPCNATRFIKFPRCRSCVAKQTDICRFKYARLFALRNNKLVCGHRFLKPENAEWLGENLPKIARAGKKRTKIRQEDRFEIPQLPLAPLAHPELSEQEVKENALYTMTCIAPSLLKVLEKELAHVEEHRDNLCYRRPSPLMGQTCDTCSTGVFSAFWMCRTCGKELCPTCYDRWSEERSFRGSSLEFCCFRANHKKAKFFPVTNYLPETIQSLLNSVKEFLVKHPGGPEQHEIPSSLFFQPEHPSLPYPYCDPSEITMKDFRACWQKGQPTVLKSAPGVSKYPCTPAHLTEHYGDVQTEVLRPGGVSLGLKRVSAFFESFDDPEKGSLDMKIKDWPSSGSFGDYFPHLNRDFTNRLPFPEYMSYTGSLNMVSLLPPSTHKVPDLGPKMYAAYAGSSGSTVGTTQLHLDAADAINVLQYSGGPSDAPGAIWDLFRREDADELRDYIRTKFGRLYAISDPIHDQAFYLTDEILNDIYETKGIRSHRVYQKIGEVVLVPAGCPHQVRNLHPCVKLAMDFVAPEGVEACIRLVSQFRLLPPGHRRGVDIIGTSTLLARSWATCLEKLGEPSPFANDDVAIFIPYQKRPAEDTPARPKRTRTRRGSTESEEKEEENEPSDPDSQ